jgi:oligogalacturonide transporter
LKSARIPRTIRPINYLAYGANDLLGAGAMAVLSGWILYFYTTFCGLSAVQATSIFAVARVIDAVASPTIGYLSDNFSATRLGRRFGRRRFFLLLSIPLVASFALLWLSGRSYGYYLATYVFFEVVYAVELIPYETLAAEMSDDYKVKARFAGSRILFGQFSAILAGILPGRIVAYFGRDSADTFLYLGIFFACLFMLVVTLVYLFTWERESGSTQSRENGSMNTGVLGTLTGLYAQMWSTLRIRAFRLHLGMYLGGYISQDIFNAAFTYFIVFALGASVVTASNMLGAMAVVQLFSVALFIQLCLRIHPAPSYRIAVSLFIAGVVGFLSLYVLAPVQLQWWLLVPVIAAGLGRGGLNYIPWSLYNYMADVDEIVTGKRREGIFAGVMTFARKAAQALAVMTVGLVLDWSGFVPSATRQSAGATVAIVTVLGLGTILLLALGALVSRRFTLNEITHGILLEEIRRFQGGCATEVPAGNRAVVEELSGVRYEMLWGQSGRNDAGSPHGF